MNEVLTPISVGELVDKITILKLKLKYIKDEKKILNIKREYELLINVCRQHGIDTETHLVHELENINEQLWIIEDKIREKEFKKEFDDVFIQLARDVYITNDERAKVKKDINLQTGSLLVEEKSYANYKST